MLYHLHVKDLALIDSADVEFGPGLNILTGETGAGKSILIGSINLALGQKANRDMIRDGKESGSVQLIFGGLGDRELEILRELEITPEEDGTILLQRKLTRTRSEIRINDEIVTLQKLRRVTEALIDIHGQHEHQSLLQEGAHLRILDRFMEKETQALRANVAEQYRSYTEAEEKRASFTLQEGDRLREMDFLEFEIGEIEAAELQEGEEERLEEKYRRYRNAEKIYASISGAMEVLDNAELSGAGAAVREALRYDESGLKGISDSLYDLESIAEDIRRELESYLDRNTFDEEDFRETEARLDLIRSVMMKYGGTVEKTEQALQEKKERLAELRDYEQARKKAEEQSARSLEKLLSLSRELSGKRKAGGEVLSRRIREELLEMGFLDVQFAYRFSALLHPGANGMDQAEFVVSLNPGEPVRPLREVASGGELSRIMLSIKTVLADTDEIPTLIFDEIDTGISGRTAEKVSDKLKRIAENHQVILITHLPQIAAKADRHFLIEKAVSGGHTRTEISCLSQEESVLELGRLLAGGSVTEAVLANARELKSLARGRRG